MKIVFMGTPDFAVPCLDALIKAGHEILCVVTQPDKPQGRKQILTAPPVKELALQNRLAVFQPEKMKTDETYEELKQYDADFFVVVAYGKILPKRILDLPKYACINVHGSLLPKYRGAAPIQWAVINGETETGVTTMLMNEGLDTGDMLMTLKTPIEKSETAGELFDRLAKLSPALLLETLEKYASGEIKPIPQNHDEATFAPPLSKDMAVLDWSLSSETLYNHIRGLNPWPVAIGDINGNKLKIFSSELTDITSEKPFGTAYAEDGKIAVVCGDAKVLYLTEIQFPGSKRMKTVDFLRGRSI
jgi:methionyl-tRNA formyltransferase